MAMCGKDPETQVARVNAIDGQISRVLQIAEQ